MREIYRIISNLSDICISFWIILLGVTILPALQTSYFNKCLFAGSLFIVAIGIVAKRINAHEEAIK